MNEAQPIKVEADKITRVHTITPLLEAGKVKLPAEAKWLKQFKQDCEDFPNGQYKDVVDSMSQALAYMKQKTRRNRGKILTVKSQFVNEIEFFKN